MIQKTTTREEREIEHFNKLASEHGYAWWGSKTPAYKVRLERRINTLTKLLNLQFGNKILECGCGIGDFTLNLSSALDENIFIYALDIAESQIKIAKNNIKKPNVNFLVGSITNLIFEDCFFDAVIGNAILHHLDIESVLKEIKRVLKPGGKLLFFEPNMLNPHIWLSLNIKPLRKLYQASPDETAFYRWDIKNKLIPFGFKNVIVKPFDFIHPLIPRNMLGIAKKIESLIEKTFLNEIAGSLIILAEK